MDLLGQGCAYTGGTLAPGNTLWPLLAWGVALAAVIHLVRAAQRFALWPAASAVADYRLTGCVPIVIASGWFFYRSALNATEQFAQQIADEVSGRVGEKDPRLF